MQDAVAYAGELGRLDLVSALLAVVSVLLALGGIAAFMEIRGAAKRKAKIVAQEETLAYLKSELPKLVTTTLRDLAPQMAAFVNTNEYSDDYSDAQGQVGNKATKERR